MMKPTVDRIEAAAMAPWLKLLTEMGPLLVFFVANARGGIFVATGAFMVAVVVALLISYWRTRSWPKMLLVSAVIVMVFGGLTLYLRDETFIKLKPTILYSLFAGVLLFGLARRRSYLKPVFEAGLPPITEQGWTKLTLRWALFFVCLAALNEAVWRHVSTDVWVNFKVFGFLPLTMIFALSQLPMVLRHGIDDNGADRD